MSYKLYTDKVNKFQCTIQVEGTSLGNSEARVILEGKNNMSYLFKGKLFDDGVCEFELPKFKNILNEGDTGIIKLEIIADDVHFEPWNSEFSVVADKKVSVVVQEQLEDKKPKIVINQISLDRTDAKPQIVEEKTEVKPKIQEKIIKTENKPKVVESQQVRPVKKESIKLVMTKKEIDEFLKSKKF